MKMFSLIINNFLSMETPTIEAKLGTMSCKISKQVNGSVNVFTNFKPLSAAVLLIELDSSPVVEYISNVSYYGDDTCTGGLSIKLAPGKTELDLRDCIEDILNSNYK
jgi:hypothetical protein